ncbi:MAG: hypothetical protein ACKOPG_10240 [Novosphingobium sp.]
MSFGDFMGLAAGMGGLVAIIAIMANLYRRRLEHKERMAELKFGGAAAAPERDNVVERLEHRLRVLERIATDKTTSLAAQIEDLREGAEAR